MSTLSEAVRRGDLDTLRSSLARGANPDTTEYGSPLLMEAAAHRQAGAAKLLVEAGANIDHAGPHGSALQIALSNQAHGVVAVLLEAGASCGIADQHGNEPLWTAVMTKCDDYHGRVARMLELGANPEHKNRHGKSPMDIARSIGDAKLLAMLEAAGFAEESFTPWSDPPASKVLAETPARYAWKKVHAALWDELVPPSGQCGTVQGEVIRCIGKLTDEAYRNGNGNWSDDHVRMVSFIENTLVGDDTFGPERKAAVVELATTLREPGGLDLSGDGSPHYEMNEAVVDWCMAHRELIPREHDPNLGR